MNFSGLGGIAIAILAGVWLLVLVPRWADGVRGDEKNASSRERIQKPVSTPVSQRERRLLRTRQAGKLAAFISGLACAAMAVFAIGNPALLVVVFLLLVAVSGAIWLARVSSRTLESLNRKATNHRPGVRVDLKTRISEPEPKVVGVIDQRSWIPNVLPEPLSNRLGQLRQHAPVVSFEQVKTDSLRQKTEEAVEPQNPTEINVTEILKRRRVI